MAEAVVSLLVSDLLWKLASPAVRQYRLLRGLEDDVSALRDTLEYIQAALQDAEVKQRKQKTVETWLKHLKSVAFEIENVFDEVSTEALLRRLRFQFQRGIKHRVRAFFSSEYNNFLVRNRIAREVKNIQKKLDAIAANRSNFGLSPTPMIADAGLGGERRVTSSILESSKIYGRDAEMEMITRKICNKDMVQCDVLDDVRVYSICGMGGIGKTTLARLVYNHVKVKTYFELPAWVYVSTEFDIEKVTSGIIESLDGKRCELSQLDAMQVELQKRLRGKRFLIVLDDVWNDDRMKWEQFSKALSCGAEGSIVMVTTRSQNIGTMMAKPSEFVHKLGCLMKEDSWSLFKMFAFGDGREGGDTQELEHIGMEIVEKCRGLPLAVKALGSLMSSKSSAREWQQVKESEIWELPRNDATILPALEISYDNLLPHMKRCFAYCCMFPKGYEMPKDLLIHLWIANGFIPSNGEADLYVLGEKIVNRLVWGSFFQDVQDDSDAFDETMNLRNWKSMYPIRKMRVQMHDLMYDLARHVMRHDCSVLEPGKMSISPDEVHHLSSSCPDFQISKEESEKLRSVRSVFIFVSAYGQYRGNINQISKHRYLRVLHLIRIEETSLPESICKLKYLRYLNLSGSGIHVLPKSIIYLQNLQVLILHRCRVLRELPEDMRYMRKLVCLDIRKCRKLLGMPVGMKELVGLQRLSSFIVGKDKNAARIGDLGDLNLLGDELELVGLSNVRGLEDAKSANLKRKRNLNSLVLYWLPQEYKIEGYSSSVHREVLEGLEPNSTLKELEIRGYCSRTKLSASWMVSLINLVKIKIWYCRCSCIPPLGKLPNLRFIDMNRVSLLKGFHDEDNIISPDHTLFPSLHELSIVRCLDLLSLPSNFPKLEKMNIAWCWELSVIPGNILRLKELDIDYCPRLQSLPDVKELNSLTITRCEDLAKRCEKEIGEDWPKISHVPNIKIR